MSLKYTTSFDFEKMLVKQVTMKNKIKIGDEVIFREYQGEDITTGKVIILGADNFIVEYRGSDEYYFGYSSELFQLVTI